MLIAERGVLALAAAFTAPVLASSCGYMGKSDGCTLLFRHQPLSGANLAEQGNVTMTVELDYKSMPDGRFVVSLGLGTRPPEAAQEAASGIWQDFEKAHAQYV